MMHRAPLSRLVTSALATLVAVLFAVAACQAEEHRDASFPRLAPLIKRVAPAVVAVKAMKPAAQGRESINPAAGFPDEPHRVEAEGSGVVVDAGPGIVITGYHLVDRAETIAVSLSDGRSAGAVVLMASEEDDLAVLRIALRGLIAIPLGDGGGVEVGDFVLAIGHPLGFRDSATFGIVSGLHREWPGIKNADLIQIDAALDQGSSGGALVDLRGELVGINIAHVGRTRGFGLAVPVDAVRTLLGTAEY